MSSLAYLGDSIWDQDHQEPHGAPSKICEVPELEEKHVTKEVKDKASHHLFSCFMGENIPADCIIALIDWFAFDLNTAEVYMHLQHDDVCLAWLEKHVKDLGFPSLYYAPPPYET